MLISSFYLTPTIQKEMNGRKFPVVQIPQFWQICGGNLPQRPMQSERPQSQVPPSVESTKALARPKRACNSQYFVHDVSRGLYLLKSEAKDIEECRQLGDGVVVFFKRLLWVQFKRFKVISSAELLLSQESFLSRDQEHAQILHDVQRGHWVWVYRCAEVSAWLCSNSA